MQKNNYSFKKGFGCVASKDTAQVKGKIMKALQITSRPAWLSRLNGTVEPRFSEAIAIEAVFAEYGIKEIWGNDESECDTD